MRESWELKTFGELCELTRGHNPPKSKFIDEEKEGYVRFYQIRDGWSDSYKVYVPESPKLHTVLPDDILMVAYRHIGKVFRGVTGAFNVALCKISNTSTNVLDNNFLFYMIPTDIIKGELMKKSERSLIPSMSVQHLKSLKIPIPPLSAQKQIVELLDKAFAAIDQAKANIEKNIQNAKELFQSKLNEIFSQKGDGWEEKTLGEVFKLKSGDGLTAKNMKEGPYPVYGGNGIAGYHESYNYEPPQVIVGRVGALCGNVRHIKDQFWLTDNAFRISEGLESFDLDFAVYLLNYKNLRDYARQAAQPVVSNSSLKDVPLLFPNSIEQQTRIKKLLLNLEGNTLSLQESYKKKTNELEELKKSILQKAFAGELTAKDLVI
jgi:type I restriction enzyme S subunit